MEHTIHPKIKPATLKVPLCPVIPDTSGNSSALFVGSEALPVCPSNKSSIKMTINMEYWWNDTDREKQSTRSRTCLTAVLIRFNKMQEYADI